MGLIARYDIFQPLKNKGKDKKGTPFGVPFLMVAGAGFEPATFGL